jgi:hypothetical protein
MCFDAVKALRDQTEQLQRPLAVILLLGSVGLARIHRLANPAVANRRWLAAEDFSLLGVQEPIQLLATENYMSQFSVGTEQATLNKSVHGRH